MYRKLFYVSMIIFFLSCSSKADFILVKEIVVGDSSTKILRSRAPIIFSGMLHQTGSASEMVFTIRTNDTDYTVSIPETPEMKNYLNRFLGRNISVRGYVEIHSHNIANGKYHPVEKFIFPQTTKDIQE